MKPAEFYFLKQPYFSKGSEMIKYTLQDLCIRDVLDSEGRKVLLNKNDTKRFLLHQIHLFHQMTSASVFIYNKQHIAHINHNVTADGRVEHNIAHGTFPSSIEV